MTRSNQTAQTGYLTRMFLRRDRFAIILWLLGIVAMVGAGASKIMGLSGDTHQVNSLATTLDTPSMAALFGPFTAVKPYTTASIFAASMMVFMGVLVGIMNIFFAIRNTRTQEDNGVLEMVRAHSVGRQSALMATLIELAIINVLSGLLMGGTLQGIAMSGADATGDWLFGIGLAVFGMMFGALALLVAQLASNARGATTMIYSVFGLLYVLRALTDVRHVDATWWTVFGWVEKIDPYGKNRLLPIWMMLGLAILVIAVTFMISTERDLGSGVLPDRLGRGRASRFLTGPIALVFRLERTTIIAWILGVLVYGVSMGTLFDTIGDMIYDNPMVVKIMGTAAANSVGRSMTLQFASMMSVVMAIGATVPAITAMLRLNSDEQKGWLEAIHARGVSRLHLFSAYTLVGATADLLTLFAGTFGMALGGQGVQHAIPIAHLMRAFWGFIPAVIVTVGVVGLILGLLPRYQQISWIIPVYGMMSIYLGGLLDFPEWTKKLTPYGWINKVPLKEVQWDQFGWLILLGIVLLLIGYGLYQRRDLVEN